MGPIFSIGKGVPGGRPGGPAMWYLLQMLVAFAGGSLAIYLFQISGEPINGQVVGVAAMLTAFGVTRAISSVRRRH